LFRLVVLSTAVLLFSGAALAAPQPGSPATRASANRAAQANKPKKPSRYAAVELFQINTKETLMLRFQDDRGRPIKGWQKRFDKFMRCHLTGTVFKMDTRLAQLLYKTARHFEGHRMEVVSGYRHPKVARNPKSPHKQGVACDFRMAGIPNTVLRDYLRKAYEHVGVGYYPNSVFVHLDDRKTGPSAFWIDYSGPGQAAEYAENPNEDLRTGQVNRRRPVEASEGADDMAGLPPPSRPSTSPASSGSAAAPRKAPVEVKVNSDPFGD
jgi:uncharacterized protein YcbK (DUF882 family)